MGEEKLFFTIGEASQEINVKPYVLRYWETEFHQLKPQKSETGQRVYRPKDLLVLKTIKNLLYDEKYTIAGAKQKLEELEKTGFNALPVSGTISTPSQKEPVPASNAQESRGRGIPQEKKPLTTKPIKREKGLEFQALLRDIQRILKKYNLA